MKILLLGCDGQLGTELQRTLSPLGTLIALGRHGQNGLCGNLEDQDGLAETIQSVRPDVIINAAAYTAVDKAETDLDKARAINATAPDTLAHEAAKIGAWLIHYSTDYVFDGEGDAPFTEKSKTAPLNVYGLTKLEGENAIRASGCKHLIFRTSWVYALHGHNFIKAIVKKALAQSQLNVVNDQYGAPTNAALLAECTATLLAKLRDSQIGTYHLVASGETTWFDYARFIVDECHRLSLPLQATSETITPVSSSEFVTPARRPTNSRLNTEKFQTTFEITLPDWHDGVRTMLESYTKTIL